MVEPLAIVYLVSLHTAALLTVAVAFIVFRSRRKGSGGALLLLAFVGVAWISCLLLAAYAPTREWAHFWLYQVRIGVVAFAPVLTLMVALQITGRRHQLRPRPLALLLAVPLVTQLFVFTPASAYFLEPASVRQIGRFWSLSHYARGPWMIVYVAYFYMTSLCALAVLLDETIRSHGVHRRRLAILITGLVLMYASVIPNTIGLVPPHYDWAVLGLSAQCALWASVLIRSPAVFALIPIARAAVLELIDDAILTIDHRGEIADANPAAASLFPHLGGHLVGTPLRSLTTRTGAPVATTLELDATQRDVEIDDRIFEARAKRLGHAGEGSGTVLVLHDVTDRKKRIDDLEAYSRAVAHDLRNPIGVIIGYAEMAADEPAASPLARELYATVIDRARDMIDTIDALLLLARIDGGTDVVREVVDANVAVQRAVAGLSVLIEEKGAHVVLAPELPSAVGYAPWVVAVFSNYLSNAVKYGGLPPRIEVGASEENDYVRYWVSDNGSGLTLAQQESLFREFSRVGERPIEGHGLGLSIVRRIAHRLGGDVGVESTPGCGCRFWFRLPRPRATLPV